MAFAVAALAAAGPSDVLEPECAAVSYPGFHAALAQVGVNMQPEVPA